MNYKMRMIKELVTLTDKKARLEVYLERESEKTKKSDEKQKNGLAQKQLNVMNEYQAILLERIFSEFEIEKKEVANNE